MAIWPEQISKIDDDKLPSNDRVYLRFVNNVREIETLIKQREPWYHDLAEKRFTEQALCYIAETDNKIVGCMWIEFRDQYIPEIDILGFAMSYKFLI